MTELSDDNFHETDEKVESILNIIHHLGNQVRELRAANKTMWKKWQDGQRSVRKVASEANLP